MMEMKKPDGRRVLVVDDDSENRNLIVEVLEAEKYEVQSAGSGQEALTKIQGWAPELVLLDYNMPGMSGLDTLTHLRKQQNYTAVIFVSANSDRELVVKCLGSGADDYIRKPFNAGELLARVLVRFRNKDVQDALASANARLLEMAEKDDVTGLYNMRFIYQKIESELKRAKRYGRQCGIIMMDVDKFKSVNDNFDHLFGSHVLKEIGQMIKKNMREIDFAARYGGDEFLLVLTETDEQGVKVFAERIRKLVEAHSCTDGKNVFKCTTSLGFSVSSLDELMSARELVLRADQGLYRAKETGRNRVVSWADMNREGTVPKNVGKLNKTDLSVDMPETQAQATAAAVQQREDDAAERLAETREDMSDKVIPITSAGGNRRRR